MYQLTVNYWNLKQQASPSPLCSHTRGQEQSIVGSVQDPSGQTDFGFEENAKEEKGRTSLGLGSMFLREEWWVECFLVPLSLALSLSRSLELFSLELFRTQFCEACARHFSSKILNWCFVDWSKPASLWRELVHVVIVFAHRLVHGSVSDSKEKTQNFKSHAIVDATKH